MQCDAERLECREGLRRDLAGVESTIGGMGDPACAQTDLMEGVEAAWKASKALRSLELKRPEKSLLFWGDAG